PTASSLVANGKDCPEKIVLFTRHYHFRVTPFWPRSRHKKSRLRGVVTRENLELAAKRGALQNVEKCLDRGKACHLFSEYEVIAFAVQRYEIETEGLRRRTRRKADIGIAAHNAV